MEGKRKGDTGYYTTISLSCKAVELVAEQQRRLDEILEYEEAERMRRSHAERWHVMQMLEWKRMMVSQMEQGRPITSPNLLMGGGRGFNARS